MAFCNPHDPTAKRKQKLISPKSRLLTQMASDGALVFSDLLLACERDTSKPLCSKADLQKMIEKEIIWKIHFPQNNLP